MTKKADENELLRSVALQNASSILIARQRVAQRSEAYLAEAQRLSHTGSFGWRPSTGEITWSEETFRIFQYDRTTKPTAELILQRVHPEDVAAVKQTIECASRDGRDFEHQYRLVMPDGAVKHVHVVAHAERDESGEVEFVGAVMDVTERRLAEKTLREREAYLAEAQKLSHTGSWASIPALGEIRYFSEECYRVLGFDPHGGQPRYETFFQRIHPDDQTRLREAVDKAGRERAEFELDYRVVHPGGEIRDIHVIGHPVVSASGDVVEFVGTVMDVTERKRAEEALRRSEAYLAEAQRLTHTGSWACNILTSELVHSSEEHSRLYGFDPERGTPSFEEFVQRIHPEDRPRVLQAFENAIRAAKDFDTQFRIVLPDGTTKYVYGTGHPVFNPSGGVDEFVGTAMDISERKRAEALRDGESRILEMIARDAPLVEILEQLVRVVEAQFAGLLCSVLLLDEDGQHVRHCAAPTLPKAYTKAIDGLCIGPKAGSCGTAMYRREPVVVTDILQDPLWEEYRDVAKSYGLRACWSTPILAHSGRVLGSFAMYYREPRSPSLAETRALEMATHLAGIAIERKLTHEQLQRSEAYLAEAQKLSQTGSWAFNSRKPVYWSEENFRMWGFNPLNGLPDQETVFQRVHPEDRDRVVKSVQKAIRERTAYAVEFKIVLPDGAVRHIHGIGHPVFNGSGELVEIVGTNVDVTERKRAEEERERLRQAQAELAHISRVNTMGELTASLAHEVNQPIAAAVTNANTCLRWLTRDQPDVERACEAVTRIVKDGTRAAEIISRIRLLFKKGYPERELTDVNEVIREIIVILQSEAMRYSISIRTDLAEHLPCVMGDRIQLQQVMMNLIMNGIDAMKDMEGTRELVIKSQPAENQQLVVSVSDTGVGLPPQADEIFKAFFTTKSHGTGMGLCISRSIVESHGGRLWAADNSPRGASFSFALPIKVEARA